jgi:hypothetical protein
MNRIRLVRHLLPGVVTAIALVAVAHAEHLFTPTPVATTVTTSLAASPTPSPSLTPHVTVNGRTVPVDANGSVTMSLPNGDGAVQTSAGQTMVTTTSHGNGSTSIVSNDQNLDVTVNGSAGDNAVTQVYGFGTSFSSSSTYSSTSVGATGTSTVQVSQ